MRSVILGGRGRWWQWDIRPSRFLGFILLIGLRERAQRLSLSRDGSHSEFWMQRENRTERLIPPPVHLVDEMAEELRRLSTWGERVADWWDRRRKCTVLSEREGKARLLLGGAECRATLLGATVQRWGARGTSDMLRIRGGGKCRGHS
jgi:hypothetical protein